MNAQMPAQSIQTRWFRLLASFTLILCLSYSAYSWLISWVTEDTLIENILSDQARQLQSNPAQVQPTLHWIKRYDQVQQLPEPVQARLRQLKQMPRFLEVAGPDQRHYHLHYVQLKVAGQQQAVYLLAEVSAILASAQVRQQTRPLLLLLALAMTALALLLAWYLTRHLVRPLLAMSQQLAQQREGQLLIFPQSQRDDEIGLVARHLQTSLQQLQLSLQREREFTRDLSHELRTPLSLLNNQLQQTSFNQAASLALMRTALHEIQHTVTVLLALARAESLETQRFNLCAEIEAAILQQHQLQREFSLTLDLPAHYFIRANQQLCRLFLQNCLENACHHGGAATQLELSLQPGQLRLCNTITTTASESPGFGHGQYLLEKIARVLDWQFHTEAQATSYLLVLQLPAPDVR